MTLQSQNKIADTTRIYLVLLSAGSNLVKFMSDQQMVQTLQHKLVIQIIAISKNIHKATGQDTI
jgi:hypothetical protein